MDMNDYKADDFGADGIIVGMRLKCVALIESRVMRFGWFRLWSSF